MSAPHYQIQPKGMAHFRTYWPIGLIGLIIGVALVLYIVDRWQTPTASPVVAEPVVAEPSVAEPAAVMQPTSAAPVAQPTEIVLNTITMDQLLKGLFRQGIRPEGPLPTVDVLLSAPVYFSATGRQAPEDALQQPSLLFYVTEDSHEELPIEPPAPELLIDGQRIGTPTKIKVLADSFHHRTSLIRYDAVDAAGQPLVTTANREIQLIFPAPGGWTAPSNQLHWVLPIIYTNDFSSWQVALGMTVAAPAVSQTTANVHANHARTVTQGASAPVVTGQSSGPTAGATTPTFTFQLTGAAILAIMAGMLTALSPCLIQLVLYFTATLAAVSTEAIAVDDVRRLGAQRHVLLTGIFFATGFTLVYTAGGAAAGFIGQSMDRVGILIAWSRPLSIMAGAIILVMALRVAWNARAPLVCHLPMSSFFGKERRTGLIGSAVMGISFATGCLACFSATILPALLLYAGATGSVTYGALLLLVFSLGITVPCLILAFGISRLQPLVVRLQNMGPYLGLASATVMAAFGVIMLTDQFHLVSSLIYGYLGLN